MRKAAGAAWIVVLTMSVLASAQTHATDTQAEASLERPVPAPTDTEINGINWRCNGDKCVGTAVGRRSAGSRVDECKLLAAAIGKLASFSSRGKELSKRDLESCNRNAR
jgi:hypothetical protein